MAAVVENGVTRQTSTVTWSEHLTHSRGCTAFQIIQCLLLQWSGSEEGPCCSVHNVQKKHLSPLVLTPAFPSVLFTSVLHPTPPSLLSFFFCLHLIWTPATWYCLQDSWGKFVISSPCVDRNSPSQWKRHWTTRAMLICSVSHATSGQPCSLRTANKSQT